MESEESDDDQSDETFLEEMPAHLPSDSNVPSAVSTQIVETSHVPRMVCRDVSLSGIESEVDIASAPGMYAFS